VKRSILASFLIVGAVAAILATVTIAPFSDSETSTGNTVAAGTLDLQVNGQDDPLPAVCNVDQLAESNTVWCGPINVHNAGSLTGRADIHFVDSSCSPGDEPESEDPGVCDLDEDLWVDVVYDEVEDDHCTGSQCDTWCWFCDHFGWHCDECEECSAPAPTPPPSDETMYQEPIALPDILSTNINLGLLEPDETDEICLSFHLPPDSLDNGDQGDVANLDIEFTLHEEAGD